jgi:hypothetical protein
LNAFHRRGNVRSWKLTSRDERIDEGAVVAINEQQTVWFSRDSLIMIAEGFFVYMLTGLGFGLLLAGTVPIVPPRDQLLFPLYLGLLWGAFLWFLQSIRLLIDYRGVSANILLPEAATLPESLRQVLKRLGYTVEQQSPTRFVCKPRPDLARLLLSLEFNNLYVQLREDSADLIGPAIAVNRVRKKLPTDSTREVRRFQHGRD